MLPLAYRISMARRGAVLAPPGFELGTRFCDEFLNARMFDIALPEAATVRLDVSNVADYYRGWVSGEKKMGDIPNWTPPWNVSWCEWTEYQNGPSRPATQYGVLCYRHDILGDWSKSDRVREIMRAYTGRDPQSANDITETVNRSRWLLVLDHWGVDMERPSLGVPMWLAVVTMIFVTDAGEVVESFVANGPSGPHRDPPEGPLLDISRYQSYVMGLTFSFCHCKNVSQADQAADRGRRFHERERVPKTIFKTLNIRPMREVLRREGEDRGDAESARRALHICRGHFAHYSEDRPLFGKYVGSFWRPDHVRGDEANGKVEKDYKVKV